MTSGSRFAGSAGSPLTSATAILTLALAIGANSAILGVAEAILFRSLPVAKPQELVLVRWTSGTTPRGGVPDGRVLAGRGERPRHGVGRSPTATSRSCATGPRR